MSTKSNGTTPSNGSANGKAAAKPATALVVRKKKKKLKKAKYEEELLNLQTELVKLSAWVKHRGLRVVALFEGRDAAGKGGAIKRITEAISPRLCRVAALTAPTERERGQWYFQRYVAHLPAAGEIVLFDRSWYNRAGVEHVMGFCTEDEYREFLRSVPEFERMLIRSGIILDEVLVLGERRSAGGPLPGEKPQPHQALEAQSDGPRVAQAMGRVLQGQGRDVQAHRSARLARGGSSRRTTSGARASTA